MTPELKLLLEVCSLLSRCANAITTNDRAAFRNVFTLIRDQIDAYLVATRPPVPARRVYHDPLDRDDDSPVYPPGFFITDDDDL